MSTAARRDAIVERAVRDGYVEAHTLALEARGERVDDPT